MSQSKWMRSWRSDKILGLTDWILRDKIHSPPLPLPPVPAPMLKLLLPADAAVLPAVPGAPPPPTAPGPPAGRRITSWARRQQHWAAPRLRAALGQETLGGRGGQISRAAEFSPGLLRPRSSSRLGDGHRSYYFRSYLRKTTGGGPLGPPSGARVKP